MNEYEWVAAGLLTLQVLIVSAAVLLNMGAR